MAIHLDYAFLPGQREVVLGPIKQPQQLMQVAWTKEFQARRVGNEYVMPGWKDEAIGSVQWKVSDDVLFGKPCTLLKMSGWTKQIFTIQKPKHAELAYVAKSASSYWLRDGKIIRQFEMRDDQFDGYRTATMTYSDDSILAFIDKAGKRDQLNINVAEMPLLHAQFTPMIVGGKVVLEKKEYIVYDPFGHGMEKRTATVSGQFNGSWGGEKYKGRSIDIEGQYVKQKAYICEEGDLVKADLPNDRYYELQSLPPCRQK